MFKLLVILFILGGDVKKLASLIDHGTLKAGVSHK